MAALLEEEREGVLDLNVVGGYPRVTALHLSCNRNWSRLAAMLLDKGADVNKASNYGTTPLNWSCCNENLELTRLLLDKRADINKADNYGSTPFYWSCRKGNLKLARFLLSRGAKDNDTAQSFQKITKMAARRGHPQLSAWLTARVGWHPMQYSCEVGWHLWSPSTHQYFPSTFRKGIVAMLLVDRRLKHQVGKDVLHHLLSYCGWDWFEVAEQQEQAEEEEEGGIVYRVSKRRKRVR